MESGKLCGKRCYLHSRDDPQLFGHKSHCSADETDFMHHGCLVKNLRSDSNLDLNFPRSHSLSLRFKPFQFITNPQIYRGDAQRSPGQPGCSTAPVGSPELLICHNVGSTSTDWIFRSRLSHFLQILQAVGLRLAIIHAD